LRYRHEDVARVCYAAIRQLREVQGDGRGPVWDLLTDEEQRWYILQVELARQGLLPEQVHNRWAAILRDDGWIQGPEVNLPKRTHPELTEWSGLSSEKRLRYSIIQMTTNALTVDVPPVWSRMRSVTAV
jgi:hypothetical protein